MAIEPTNRSNLEPTRSVLSGLSEGEAKEFNRIFVISFIIFTSIALVAHLLAWLWRPWGGNYHAAMLDGHFVYGLHFAGHMLTALT